MPGLRRIFVIFVAASASALASAGATPSSGPPGPAEFLSVRHAAYEEIEALAARGLLDSIQVYTRPLARTEVARALVRAAARHPEIAQNLHYQRLERELARELTDLDAQPARAESGPLVDTGNRDGRFRVQAAAHVRGDYDEKRAVAHFRLRDETSTTARLSFQAGSAFGAFEEIGVTRIRSQRAFIDAIALHTDLETTTLRAELTAHAGGFTGAAGYDMFRWGPGRRGTLLLSDAAGPMGFLSFSEQIGGRVTATALSGQLSRADHRFLAAHRIEASVSRRLSVGLAEAVRYPSDGVDLLYASGLIPYAIVERTHIRDASTDSLRGSQRANIMASLDVVWRPSQDLSLYGEVLLDDIATENRDMPDRFAYQAGFRSERDYGSRTAHLIGEYTRVLNFTYAVDYGQNFIHRDHPLGFALGPDVENVFIETGYDLSRDWGLRWTGDFTNRGEGRLGDAWVETQGPVSNVGLSGVVEERREVFGDVRWLPRDNVDLTLGLGYRRVRNEDNVAGRERTAWLGRLAAELRY